MKDELSEVTFIPRSLFRAARSTLTLNPSSNLHMKRLLSLLISLAFCSALGVSQQTGTARVNGTILDIAGGAIPNVQVTIENSANSFRIVSDENGKFQIHLPPGRYEVRSDKLPGFAATKQEISLATNKTAEMTITPAVSQEGVLCILTITARVAPKRRMLKRHR